MNESTFIKINPADNVVVCLRPFQKGETIDVDGKTITLLQDTPAGHKVLTADAPEGSNIIKYGYPIGHAITDLKAGTWVSENNLKTNLAGTLSYEYHPVADSLDIAHEDLTFQGYRRANGEVGVRNEIWIVPTVGCVNGIAERLVNMLTQETGLQGIDAIHAWNHNYGCSQLSGDHENTRKVLRDICLHPNAGGVLVLSLGCENNQPDAFMEMLGDYDRDRIKLLVTQKVEGDELEEGMKILRQLYDTARHDQREAVPLSELRVGLKCGGSDGFSGISADRELEAAMKTRQYNHGFGGLAMYGPGVDMYCQKYLDRLNLAGANPALRRPWVEDLYVNGIDADVLATARGFVPNISLTREQNAFATA